MLKKNQLALILLTLVMMLTVYYITSPFDKADDTNPDDTEETTGRFEELSALRAALRDERALEVLSLDAVIADTEKTIDEKEAALEQKRFINWLSEKELLLELEVIKKGYRDCFVHAMGEDGVEITVVSDDHSLSAVNEITILTMTSFELDNIEDVSVKFATAEEVMGEVNN